MKQNQLSVKCNNALLKVKKRSPEISIVIGVMSFVGTVVLASRASIKASKIMEEHHQNMEDIRQAANAVVVNPEPGEEYTDEDYKHDKLVAYSKTAVELSKTYAPVIACATLSLTAFLAAYNITRKRYLGVVGAYNALQGAFKAYRKRVVEELGSDMDRHFLYGTETNKISVKDENGKKIETKVEEVNSVNVPNSFARIFDDSNPNWDKNNCFNRMFLNAQQDMLNNLLHTRGHVFLNEVYDALGFERTPEGQVVGWCLGAPENDGYIDFGLYDMSNENIRRFVNGDENVVLLDFNVDGVIYNLIDSFRGKR